MRIDYQRLAPEDTEALVEFLLADPWPFHAGVQNADAIRQRVASGVYDDADNRTFWQLADGERAGLIRLTDLTDPTPMFDLRISSKWRGRGLGKAAVRWLTEYLFNEFPEIRRVEGQTRRDNAAMRAVFRACAYVKEAHYREAWPGPDGSVHDCIAYAILRRDWETGTTTPVAWDDEPARP
ncbi:GNAT family N-acetyltransferase [Nonomuraea sp. NPDC049309]|uniref:GNAT family N-acetyltransferase n=1 Tax=Nonomuraea sp. NPDC049309 TaxID=3364350 RepID=UPI0037122FFC